ncbi:alpha/beta hydrolase family protein [Oceanicola sp. S124]|uniref:alpha/beta hydrolase family protein n=1 Tax=Oceanicola sp. S124 TaxID=1042378 RepID=UPI0002559433|nr:alpha/beta fold hydrolase [Oceanicola sp. S124]
MRFLALLILGLVTATSAPAEPLPVAPSAVGFRALEVPGIEAVAWYPTLQTAPVTTVAGNKIFVGVSVVRDAPIAGAAHPVALLSHGYSGLWRNQAWLAEHLARAGFIAVALNQPGTTFGDMDPDWARDLALRPQQVSRVLDALLADPHLGPRIDDARISVVGHSLGGSTALLLSGGLFDPSLLVEACGEDRDKLLCTLYRAGGLTKAMAPVSARDPRISAAVLLDMEGIHAFTPDSLARLPVPVLALVSGVEDPALPLGWEGRTQAARLPAATSRYAEIPGATHFSFMSTCREGAAQLLGEEAFVCEGETAPRPELHAEIARMVLTFLKSGTQLAFPLQSP